MHLPLTIHGKRIKENAWKIEKSKRPMAILTLIVFCCISLIGNVSAAPTEKQAQPPKGITVSPAFQLASVKANEDQHTLNFKVTNNRPTDQTINFSVADFNTLGESGGLAFVGTNPTELQKKYGLANWVRLSQTSATIAPGQTATINASVLNDSSLAPGGHYGALLLSLDTGNASGQNKIALKPIASSLLFVTKVGGDTHKMALAGVDASHSIFKLPDSVNLRFKNSGNTHLVPRGIVNVTAPDGTVVKKGVINENSSIILPETYRLYSVPLKNIAHTSMPGNYKLSVDFRFDDLDQYRRYQTSLFLLPPIVILVIPLILAIAGFCAYYLFKKPHLKKYFSKQINRLKKTFGQ